MSDTHRSCSQFWMAISSTTSGKLWSRICESSQNTPSLPPCWCKKEPHSRYWLLLWRAKGWEFLGLLVGAAPVAICHNFQKQRCTGYIPLSLLLQKEREPNSPCYQSRFAAEKLPFVVQHQEKAAGGTKGQLGCTWTDLHLLQPITETKHSQPISNENTQKGSPTGSMGLENYFCQFCLQQ